MLSIFSLFIVEIVAFRWGTAKLAALGIGVLHDVHGQHVRSISPPPETIPAASQTNQDKGKDELAEAEYGKAPGHDHGEKQLSSVLDNSAAAQIIGIAILEFGVLLHRFARISPFVRTLMDRALLIQVS
jgi:solute carrier family 39 (zinc transporter), member 1/2/3